MTFLPDIDRRGQSRYRYAADCAGAQLHAYARSIATVVRVDGEIDAHNAEIVAQEIRRFARLKTPLILDLSQLEFIAVDGFRTLLVLNCEQQKARLLCSVIVGSVLRRLLHIVGDHGLLIADSVPEALQLVDDVIRSRRRLVSSLSQARQSRHDRPLKRLAGDYS